MPPSPVEHWPFRLHTRIDSDMLSPLSFHDEDVTVYICAAGLSLVSLDFVAATNNKDIKPKLFKIADVDTLRGCIDRTTSSWTYRLPKDRVVLENDPVGVKLMFANPCALDVFLIALSYVRIAHGHSSLEPDFSHDIPSTENLAATLDVTTMYINRREEAYRRAPIHVLPIEVLSLIFVFLPAARNQYDRTSPLHLLHVCATWRAVALGTAALWRRPSFTIARSFFGNASDNACRQMLEWVARARSPTVALSLALDLPSEELRMTRFNLSPLAVVDSLRLSAPQSQLVPFLEDDSPVLRSLTSLALELPELDLGTSLPRLCQATISLRTLTIQSPFGFVGGLRLPSNPLLTAFPWSRLTTLSLVVFLPISIWMPVFAQCLSLKNATFALRRDPYDYPLKPVTFPDLVVLRVSFPYSTLDTEFLDHIILPTIHELHISGVVKNHLPIAPFMYPTLRNLVLEVNLAGVSAEGLHRILCVHPGLEQLTIVAGPECSLPQIEGGVLRHLAVCITDRPVESFVSEAATWALAATP
ncbi:hypothetical protein B0H16DRAFT_1741785 [Mycena metata]|uniref:F-box domain-containing protein n=1 Tax=Mycena metata TaxID=1033252 RepID=A0AAD7H9F9_9AGAR|nr:hypothetical protein B0H16DRAFT_1741785 [Mycena metata]